MYIQQIRIACIVFLEQSCSVAYTYTQDNYLIVIKTSIEFVMVYKLDTSFYYNHK